MPYREKLRAPEDKRFKNHGEWLGPADTTSRKSNSSGARGSHDSKQSVPKTNETSNRNYRNGEGDDDDLVVSSPAQNQGSTVIGTLPDDIALELFPTHGKEIDSISKKRKPDEGLFKNNLEEVANTMDIGEDPLALVPFTRGPTASVTLGANEVSDGSKKMKKENAGLLQQPRGPQRG